MLWYNKNMSTRNNREKIIVRTSLLGVCANLVLVGFKAAVGLLSNSIAIISDAINNLSDALSSIITIVGTKLAGKAPDKKHPYGYGRIEYITALIVSAIVLYAGITALVESVRKIFVPEEVEYNTITLVVLVAGIIVKFALGLFVKKKGRDIKSNSLIASGTDAFSDAILSISVLASAIIYLLSGVNLEAYVGALVSLFIIKTGIVLIKESVDNMLGMRVESKLAKAIKEEVLKEEKVEGAFDLVLHDYGPDKYLGSIHIEVPDTLSVAELDKISRDITKRVLKKFGVILHTIGVYSINTADKEAIAVRKKVEEIVFSHPEILEMHGFYLDKVGQSVSLDIIMDFKTKDREGLYRVIYDEIQKELAGYKINITLDIDASD